MADMRAAHRAATGDHAPGASGQFVGAVLVGVGEIAVRLADDDTGAEGVVRLAFNSLDELRAQELAGGEVRGQLSVFERAGRRVRVADDTVEVTGRAVWPGV